MNKTTRRIIAFMAVLCMVIASAVFVSAGSPTDEILLYEITADVNDDATVNLAYHIQWKVLESDGIGPMSWINVGIPNSHVISVIDYGSIVDSVEINGSSVSVYLDRDYYEGEIADIEFTLIQDYMYSMNQLEDGYTNYSFTPGWFDEIQVDEYVFRWNATDASGWSPDCLQKGGYLTWTGSLRPGETVSLSVNYPNEAFDFVESKSYNNVDDWGYDDYYYDDYYYDDYGYSSGPDIVGVGVLIWFVVIGVIIANVAKKAKNEYDSTATFGSGETKKKVTRTKVEYYPVCQGCGAPRAEGEETCSHCGRSFIKSEETVTEEEVKAEDKDALKHNTSGIYHYGSSPNTYMRVNVINVPIHHSTPRPSSGSRPSSSSRSGSSRSSGRSGGGCAHSSCACACVSCACACACACAGGGRAGCTYKDFYRTDLKLKQLELKKTKNSKSKNQ